MLMLDWRRLRTLTEPVALSSVTASYRVFSTDVCQFSEHEFGVISSFNPEISSFWWAGEVASVQGILCRNPSAVDILRLPNPHELLLEDSANVFDAVLRLVSFGKYGPHFAGPDARRASLFESVRRISFLNMDFFYSSPNENWIGEVPVLIAVRMSSGRWEKLGVNS
jgi:hypothetical protein